MSIAHHLRRLALAVFAAGAVTLASLSASLVTGALTPAVAQMSEEFQYALEPYGEWRPHPRFGEIWVPARVPPDWRPYQYGHWVYTDDWGWYWVSDEQEADWGWVTFHYGRWAFEPPYGWFWVPGDEWAPAWGALPPDAVLPTPTAEPVPPSPPLAEGTPVSPPVTAGTSVPPLPGDRIIAPDTGSGTGAGSRSVPGIYWLALAAPALVAGVALLLKAHRR